MKRIELGNNGEILNNCDFESKYQKVVEQLDKEVFSAISTQEPSVEEMEDNWGRCKKKEQEELSALYVSSRLNEYLRIYRPLSLREAKDLEEQDLMDCFAWFMKLISHINQHCVFVPSKQTFCAFATLTTSVYNELLQDSRFQTILEGVEDYLIEQNFLSSQAGLVREKSTITKLQTRDAGHNLIKSPDAITVNTTNILDTGMIQQQLAKFNSMTKQITNNKK